MGILTRQQGDVYVISSDRASSAPQTTRAPSRSGESYEVWTGDCWSAARDDAMPFASLDAADDYVRQNLARIMG
jgi:hypothetical protein